MSLMDALPGMPLNHVTLRRPAASAMGIFPGDAIKLAVPPVTTATAVLAAVVAVVAAAVAVAALAAEFWAWAVAAAAWAVAVLCDAADDATALSSVALLTLTALSRLVVADVSDATSVSRLMAVLY